MNPTAIPPGPATPSAARTLRSRRPLARVRTMTRAKFVAYVVTIVLAPGSVILAASVRPFT